MNIFEYDFTTHEKNELIELKGIIDKAIEGIEERERQVVLDEFISAANALEGLGVSPEAALGGKRGRAKVKPKYRNPENPSEVWTGRGRKPRWVVEKLNKGVTLESLLIAA